uniref:Uncharacterized protein n=1 Tax=Mycena chlorophos TaxID=658473 RepID=A0ABQ0LAN1_MYCCL|nr:predicted protein [Mycena chlorophos]
MQRRPATELDLRNGQLVDFPSEGCERAGVNEGFEGRACAEELAQPTPTMPAELASLSRCPKCVLSLLALLSRLTTAQCFVQRAAVHNPGSFVGLAPQPSLSRTASAQSCSPPVHLSLVSFEATFDLAPPPTPIQLSNYPLAQPHSHASPTRTCLVCVSARTRRCIRGPQRLFFAPCVVAFPNREITCRAEPLANLDDAPPESGCACVDWLLSCGGGHHKPGERGLVFGRSFRGYLNPSRLRLYTRMRATTGHSLATPPDVDSLDLSAQHCNRPIVHIHTHRPINISPRFPGFRNHSCDARCGAAHASRPPPSTL